MLKKRCEKAEAFPFENGAFPGFLNICAQEAAALHTAT